MMRVTGLAVAIALFSSPASAIDWSYWGGLVARGGCAYALEKALPLPEGLGLAKAIAVHYGCELAVEDLKERYRYTPQISIPQVLPDFRHYDLAPQAQFGTSSSIR